MSSSETRISTTPPVDAPPVEHLRLGRMRRLDAREIWRDAAGVIPWLRSSPELLGEALRLQIQPSAEHRLPEAIGELTPGLPVLVKARFEEPLEGDVRDLAGMVAELDDAGIIVLLAPGVPEGVQQGLHKLNRNTAKVIAFYGVEFDLWQIDESAPAPMFRVVAGPEGWDRSPKDPDGGATGAAPATGTEELPAALQQGATSPGTS